MCETGSTGPLSDRAYDADAGRVRPGHPHIPPPTLRPAQVVVRVENTRQPYIGLVVPHVLPNRPTRLILRFAAPTQTGSLLVSDRRSNEASNWDFLDNPDCKIRKV